MLPVSACSPPRLLVTKPDLMAPPLTLNLFKIYTQPTIGFLLLIMKL